MPEFVLAPCVEDELWAIWSFIARDNPDAAARVVEAAFDTFKQLAERPGLGRSRKFNHPRLKDIHTWQISGFSSYQIFYCPTPKGIEVLHVFHGARDIDALFGE